MYTEQISMGYEKRVVEVVPCYACTKRKELLGKGTHFYCHFRQCKTPIDGFCDAGEIKVMEYFNE